MRLIAFVFLIAAMPAFGQKFLQGKTPDWVTQYSFQENVSDTLQSSGGYAYLLISSQANLETNEFYRRYVMKVTSQDGLSTVSSINEYFEPSYQNLIFHELNIIRNGKKINRLDLSKFEVLRREEEMDRAMYDKSLSAIYNMPDVRVGDIVEYSFTRTGFNPIFKNHRFGYFYLQYGVPVDRFACKIVFDNQRKLQFKSIGDSGPVIDSKVGSWQTREWVRDHVPAMLTDDQIPSWYDAYSRIDYSDFQSWEEVKSWALAIYQYPTIKNGDLKRQIESINNSGKTDEEKIKACIRIAQANIRYLSFSDGIHGYKPHDPEMVYDQRYGDCKDKSFLLSYMLNSIGVKSAPALVSTDTGYKLTEALPSPWAFDHCIVQFTHQDSTYWIDPTISGQLGPLKSYYFPSYYHALVISHDQSDLDSIPYGYKNSRMEVKEEYSMLEVGGYVNLKVESSYYGDEADRMRNHFRINTLDEINKNYLNFCARDYSEITIEKNVAFADDTVENIFRTTEQYLVKNFWTIADNNKTADIFASVVSTYLKKPDTRLRKMPLFISHPQEILHTIKIRLPERWEIEDSRVKIESDGFLYESSRFSADETITMRFRYKSKASFIEANKTSEHVDKISQALADNGYTIFKPLASGTDSAKNMFVAVFIIVVAGVFVMRWMKG
jgi:hypothetical protein